MRKLKLTRLSIVLIVLFLIIALVPGNYWGTVLGASASASNFTFGQLDWYDETGVLQVPNSSWGLMEFDVTGDATQLYYLNVVANAGFGNAWIVRNLPIFPDTIGWASPRQGADFDITLLSVSAGTDLPTLSFVFSVDSAIRNVAPSGPMTTVPVANIERRSFGSKLASPPLPADVGQPIGVQIFMDVSASEAVQHKNVPGVQEQDKTCLAGAFARSIGWLNAEYKLGSKKTAQEIYDDLRNLKIGSSGPGAATYEQDVAAKNKYLKAIDNRTVTKILDLADAIGKVDGVNEETGVDLLRWLKKELPTEDVELHYDEHIITVTGMYRSGGKTFIKYRDDETQGTSTSWTGDETKDNRTKGDKSEKHAEITKGADGKYVFREKGGKDFFKVQAAISQSIAFEGGGIVEAPFGNQNPTTLPYAAIAASVLGLAAVIAAYRWYVVKRRLFSRGRS